MATQKVNTFISILGRTPEYKDLFTQVNQLNEMQQIFSTVVPTYLAKQSVLGRFINGKLSIFAENGSIATKLKQISPSLLLKLQKLGWKVTAIQITVQAHYYSQNSTKLLKSESSKKKLQLSQAGIENLGQLAAKLPNSELKNAIELLLKKH
tara:strand:- start:4612 stop:5067 length:456 start_codon:yes stop_codon:yes gene_type:complete